MTKMDRIEQLLQFIEQSPNDPFLVHALALEYVKREAYELAEQSFLRNMQLDKNYIPTYFHLGKLYEKAGDPERAKVIYQEGMERCRVQQDFKTLNELNLAYEFLDED